MRIWEVEDNRMIPSNLVREQDFILRVRRLQRLGSPTLVVNIVLSAVAHEHIGQGNLEEVQGHLQAFVRKNGGAYAEMSNGDVFLIWPDSDVGMLLTDQVMSVVFPGDSATPEDVANYRHVFHLPSDYAVLRACADHYVEISRDAVIPEPESTPAQLLQSESARGPLTAWSADLIGKLLQDIDVHRYLKTQAVYEREPYGTWRPLFVELFLGFSDLRQAHFPKMEIEPSEHLFLELCQTADRLLLTELTRHPEIMAGNNLSLNLSVASIMGAGFALFAHALPHADRGTITCELNNADLWQDFTLTLGAMESLRHEGFKSAIDGVTPDMLGYINLSLFDTDYIKINVSKDHVAALMEPKARAALAALPRDKLIFFRCDNQQALALGIELGVTRFQGWLIDDAVKTG